LYGRTLQSAAESGSPLHLVVGISPEKRAKAEQAMQAVDHLIEGIADDLGKIEKSR
jgi:hypothetical protein